MLSLVLLNICCSLRPQEWRSELLARTAKLRVDKHREQLLRIAKFIYKILEELVFTFSSGTCSLLPARLNARKLINQGLH